MSDECFKMALTDALSVACKSLGVAADVYFEKDRSKYDNVEPQKDQQQEKPQQATNISSDKKLLSQNQLARLYAIAKKKGRTGDQVQAAVKSHYKIDHMNELTKQQYDEVVKKYESMADVEEVKGE